MSTISAKWLKAVKMMSSFQSRRRCGEIGRGPCDDRETGTGVEIEVSAADRARLEAMVVSRSLHADLGVVAQPVETLFAKLTGRRLERGVFRSIVDLQAAINRFIEAHDHDRKPLVWIAGSGRILPSVRRGHQTWRLSTS